MLRLSRFRVLCGPVCLICVGAPSSLTAQSVITISPQQCVWHAGDNPTWAAPNLDEAGWLPYTQWKLNPAEPHYWVRCHADLSPLRGTARPTIQLSLYAAYQLYLNGELIGENGNLHSGFFRMNAIRSFSVQEPMFSLQPATLTLRIAYRYSDLAFGTQVRLPMAHPFAAEIHAADSDILRGVRANAVLAELPFPVINFLCYGITGILGVVLLGQFLLGRSRRDLLLLGLASIGMASIYAYFLSVSALLNLPVWANLGVFATAVIVAMFSRAGFFFAVAGQRMPLLFWLLAGLASLRTVLIDVALLLPLSNALWLNSIVSRLVVPVSYFAAALIGIAPFIAFWPYHNVTRRTMPLALLCMTLGISEALVFSMGPPATVISGVPDILRSHDSATILRAFLTAAVFIALMALLSRDQQRTSRERAILAGEMQAAQQVQCMLAPAVLDTVPGMRIEVAFHPIREVGGDFYSCRILPGSRERILIGDVSGKGAAAAMTAAVLLGAAQRRDDDPPPVLLEHLNQVLVDMRLGGFATCVCAELSADGVLTLANAGHLAPYRNGDEIHLESGLPLGIAPDGTYVESTIRLTPNDQLTFLSDGVVEAQNSTGELFGFDRTCRISHLSANQIARTAQAHGQEDDITVLTLQYAPAEVLRA